MYVIPWNIVWLLANPVPEVKEFSRIVTFPLKDTTVSYTINGTIILRARGAISADNPITAEAFIGNLGILNLPSVTKTTTIVVVFLGTFEYPLKPPCYCMAGMIYIDLAKFPWDDSTSMVYHRSGNFDVIVRFQNSNEETIQETILTNEITVGSQQETFAYVTSVAFVSLDVIIVALMLLEFRDTRADDGSRRQKKCTETEP